jgi:hypothetical protein
MFVKKKKNNEVRSPVTENAVKCRHIWAISIDEQLFFAKICTLT